MIPADVGLIGALPYMRKCRTLIDTHQSAYGFCLPESDVKQHYLAQTYQGGFVNPNAPPDYDPYVWIYFRKKQAWKAKAPINFAWVTDLYTVFHADGTRDDSIEKLLSVYEGQFATAMRRDIRREPFSDNERMGVAGFMALLLVRPPRFLQEFLPRIFGDENILRMLADKLPRFAEALKKTFKNPDPKDLAGWYGTLNENEQKLLHFTLLLPPVQKTAEKLYDLSWAFIVFPPDERLISSDTPISFTNASGQETPLDLQQIDDPNVEIAMPMSAHLALVLHHYGKKRQQAAGPANAGAAADLNRRVLWQSREFIFTSDKSFPGDEDLAAWTARSPMPDIARVRALVSRLRK